MKVTLVLATTTTPLSSGVTFGYYRFKVPGQDDVDTQQTTVEYDLAPGSYSASCQAYAADGTPLGFASLGFTVPDDSAPAPEPAPATYEAPSALTVRFG
jgi:hypothetical protein